MSINSTLFLQREVRVFAAPAGAHMLYEIPILEGLSFSQSTNISEVTINEAASSASSNFNDAASSRRGRAAFTDSLAPAEWSFSTYMRPTKSGSAYAAGDLDNAALHGATEEVLWAALANTFVGQTVTPPADGTAKVLPGWTFGTTGAHLSFADSNTVSPGKLDLYFMLGSNAADTGVTYFLKDAVVNEVTIDFDIEGIATCNWSGFATSIVEVGGDNDAEAVAPHSNHMGATGIITPDITQGNLATNNMIQNRLSTLTIENDNTTGDPNTNYLNDYNITLTGGSITISNNISYVTPSSLGVVNQPLGAINGTRSVSGSLTCYLDTTAAGSADFLEDLLESSTYDEINLFRATIYLGGEASSTVSATPGVKLLMPLTHFEIPAHSVGDVISVETNFHALPSDVAVTNTNGIVTANGFPTGQKIDAANEIFVEYKGQAVDTNTAI